MGGLLAPGGTSAAFRGKSQGGPWGRGMSGEGGLLGGATGKWAQGPGVAAEPRPGQREAAGPREDRWRLTSRFCRELVLCLD